MVPRPAGCCRASLRFYGAVFKQGRCGAKRRRPVLLDGSPIRHACNFFLLRVFDPPEGKGLGGPERARDPCAVALISAA